MNDSYQIVYHLININYFCIIKVYLDYFLY